jgi:hypothetical protein
MPCDTMNRRFIDFIKFVIYDVQKADYDFQGPFAYLKHHLSDVVQVAFFDAQDGENDLALLFDTLKQRFISMNKIIL